MYHFLPVRSRQLELFAIGGRWGNFGSTGSFMFYHPALELYLIGSLNRFGSYGKAIRLMMKCIDIAAKG
ncbi:hypothetical protein [Paenibacillus ehimensis]|uniref:hypothetical protein n=1 Tax=Paenibacillus ehimensis TaxID=79264 RepID=UPI002674D663|nr:hypothetical protein [Paenibacillus ehimensis]